MDSMKKQLEIRNKATAFYICGEFEGGDALLADSLGVLPNYIRLKCVGIGSFIDAEAILEGWYR